MPLLWVSVTAVLTKDIDDLCVPKGDNPCLWLQHRAGSQHWDPMGLPGAAQQHQGKALPAGNLGALHKGNGISSSSRGDNSLLLVGFTQGKFHETQLLLQAMHESNGNPQQPHRTWLRVKLSQGKLCSSLLCQWDGDWGYVLCSQPGTCLFIRHVKVYYPLPKGTAAQIMKS